MLSVAADVSHRYPDLMHDSREDDIRPYASSGRAAP